MPRQQVGAASSRLNAASSFLWNRGADLWSEATTLMHSRGLEGREPAVRVRARVLESGPPRANLAGRSRVRAKKTGLQEIGLRRKSLLIHGPVRKRANPAPNGGRSEEELRPALGHDKSPRPGGNRHLERDWRGRPRIEGEAVGRRADFAMLSSSASIPQLLCGGVSALDSSVDLPPCSEATAHLASLL
jgi:hypothetical protein